MKKIRSIQVLRRFAFDEWGGTETVVWNSTKKLIEKGFQSSIMCTIALSKTDKEIIENVLIERFPYSYTRLNLKKKSILDLDKKGGNPYSWQLFKKLLNSDRIDILHSHTMQRLANTVRWIARIKKIPYVVSFHGGFFDVPESEMEEMLKPMKGSFNYGKLFDIAFDNDHFLKNASGILCVGYNEYLLTKEKYPNKIVQYLPNAVDIEKFKAKTTINIKQKLKISNDTKLILCVSRIDYQKNQILLVELLKKLIDKQEKAHLLLIGPITSIDFYNKIKQKIDIFNLQKHITIIEGLNPEDSLLVSAFKSADCFILPSIHEPFGIVALEAWAAKLPIIASNVGGLGRLIENKKTGLQFESNNLEQLYLAYSQLFSNNSLKESLIENSYQEVCEKYSWDSITDQLINFYEEVIDKFKKENR